MRAVIEQSIQEIWLKSDQTTSLCITNQLEPGCAYAWKEHKIIISIPQIINMTKKMNNGQWAEIIVAQISIAHELGHSVDPNLIKRIEKINRIIEQMNQANKQGKVKKSISGGIMLKNENGLKSIQEMIAERKQKREFEDKKFQEKINIIKNEIFKKNGANSEYKDLGKFRLCNYFVKIEDSDVQSIEYYRMEKNQKSETRKFTRKEVHALVDAVNRIGTGKNDFETGSYGKVVFYVQRSVEDPLCFEFFNVSPINGKVEWENG